MSVRTCPECGGDTIVYDSRPTVTGDVVRNRKCLSCGYRFQTRERFTREIQSQRGRKGEK